MTLVNLATGLAFGVAAHSMMEPSNIRNRVKELEAKRRGEPYEAPL